MVYPEQEFPRLDLVPRRLRRGSFQMLRRFSENNGNIRRAFGRDKLRQLELGFDVQAEGRIVTFQSDLAPPVRLF
jgi:hypothetical protein